MPVGASRGEGESRCVNCAVLVLRRLIGAAPPPSPDAQAARDRRAGQPGAAAAHDRDAGQLRHAAHALVADRPEARDRRGAQLGAGRVRAELGGLRRLPGIVDPSEMFTGATLPDADPRLRHGRDPARDRAPQRRVIIQGHIDSRVTDIMNATVGRARRERRRLGHRGGDRGGAGAVQAQVPGTIVYAALSGEEQGLYGGKVLANYAKAQGWNVVTVLNNDIIGNSCSSDGVCDSTHARVLSEGPRSQGQADLTAATHSLGGENDAPSRNISRFLDSLADRLKIGLDVRQIWRTDRFGRGGDHIPFLELGYPGGADQRRGRELQLAAPGSEDRERHPLWRHDRPCRFRLSRQDDEAEHRRARGHRQRPAAARAEGRRRGEHGYDGDVAPGREPRSPYKSLATHRRKQLGSSREPFRQVRALRHCKTVLPHIRSTIGCSAFLR